MSIINLLKKSNTLKEFSNILGLHTDRHLVIFESDDWGSIRMPSLSSFEKLERLGLDLRSADAERYNLNDSLASDNDLERLFEVLSDHKDSNGNRAVFTPLTIVANPDFKKISDSGFTEYFYEPFTETLKRYPGCEHSFAMWEAGIENKLFLPQLHGREHLNVAAWMRSLNEGEMHTLAAFDEKLWGFVPDKYPKVDYQAAFLLGNSDELRYQERVIAEGAELFKNIFKYAAVYFVPPNGMFNNSLNRILVDHGIKFRYASKIQHETIESGKSRKAYHYLGQKDNSGLSYIVRNCFFEPSQGGKNWVDNCLRDISSAFRWRKPAIISTHRVNYIGSLNPGNRDSGLIQLNLLLSAILKNWPDVQFIPTSDLEAIIKN